MENKKAPSLQFYPKDALDVKVIRMSDAAQGIYWRLLFNIWSHTETQYSIKNCAKSLSKILGLSSTMWKKYYKEIQPDNDPIFIEENGMLISKRLRIEKLKQIEWRKKSRKGGLKSAEQRATKNQPPLQPNSNPSSSSSSSSSSTTTTLKKKSKSMNLVYENPPKEIVVFGYMIGYSRDKDLELTDKQIETVANKFYNHYSSEDCNWTYMAGGTKRTKMKDWKAKARDWLLREGK